MLSSLGNQRGVVVSLRKIAHLQALFLALSLFLFLSSASFHYTDD